jgi:hypothetical protein
MACEFEGRGKQLVTARQLRVGLDSVDVDSIEVGRFSG